MRRLLAMTLAFSLMLPTVNVSAKEAFGENIRQQTKQVVSNEVVQEETDNLETVQSITIDATDYGADPTGLRDSTEAIWQAFEAAKEASEQGTKPVTVFFPNGEYHVYKDKAQQREYHTSNTSSTNSRYHNKHIGILIEDQKNLTIEGDGSLFMIHGDMMALAIVRSENIRLHNFSWDYAVPTVTEMTVLETKDNYTDFYIPQCFPYEIKNNTIVWKSDNSPYTGQPYWTKTGAHESRYSIVTHQPDTEMSRAYGEGQNPFKNVTGIEARGENVVRISYSSRPGTHKPGMVFMLCSSAVRPTAGAFTWESREVTAEKINVHYMDGFGWLIQMSENVYYKDCNLMPRANSGHLTTSYADGIHASGAAGKIVIDNCNFSYTHDDPINLHGTFTRVEQRVNDYTLKLKYIHEQQGGFPQFHEGDKVQFFTRNTLESTDGEKQYTVAEVISNPGEKGNDLKTMEVRFAEELPADLSEQISGQPKYVAENVTYAPEVIITNCTFKNIVTRGILCTTRNKVLIEDNIFYPTSMATIYLSNDSNNWYESGPIRDMTIRGNIFYIDDIGRTSWNYAPAIYVNPVTLNNGLPSADNPIHKCITIEDNKFYMNEDVVVYARSVEDLVFKNNTVLRMNPDIKLTLNPEKNELQSGSAMSLNLVKTGRVNNDSGYDGDIVSGKDNVFKFEKSKDVTISGNTYDDGLKKYVVTDQDTENTLDLQDEDIKTVRGDDESPSPAVGKVTFVNSNPDVAYVDEDGTVIGLKAGTATIYAYYQWDGTIIKSNEVTINVTGDEASGSIIISKPTTTWNDGFSLVGEDQANYEVTPASYAVKMQSGDLWEQSNTLKNLLLFEPQGVEKNNLRTIVKVSGLPQRVQNQNWDTASFILYKDSDNYITVGKKAHKDGFSYVVEKNQTGDEIAEANGDNNSQTSAYLGFTKIGDQVTISVKTEGGTWKDLTTQAITNHTIGNDYKIGFGVWGAVGKTVTFSDFKVGAASQSYEDLENADSVSFLKGGNVEIDFDNLQKNPVVDDSIFKSSHVKLKGINIEELEFSKESTPETSLTGYDHIAVENGKNKITINAIKDSATKEIKVLYGDYRRELPIEANGNTYTAQLELVDGLNTIYIRAYAEDGITYEQHIIAFTYMPAYVVKEITDGFLEEIIFEGQDITNECMIAGVSSKKTSDKESVKVKVRAKEGAEVTFGLEGSILPEVSQTVMEADVSLNPGEQRIKIVITKDGGERIYFINIEKALYLSDMEWESANTGWNQYPTPKKDAAIETGAIVLLGDDGKAVTFAKGIGTHATSTIKYDISNVNYNTLSGYVGIDYSQKGKTAADVQFIILIDGNKVFDSEVMRITDPMKEVKVTIPSGARELELQALDCGGNGNDHADWADMKFCNYYTVSFQDENGEKLALEQIIESNKKAEKPLTPQKEGYTFTGWLLEGELYDFNKPVLGDIILKASWREEVSGEPDGDDPGVSDVIYYTVSFNDTEGGKLFEAQTVSANTLLAEVTVPVKAGYAFRGWFREGVKYDFRQPVTKNLILTAGWIYLGDIADHEKKEIIDLIADSDIVEIDDKVWAVGVKNLQYNGKNQTQEIRVYDGTKLLKEKKDYTISYKNNKNAYTVERDGVFNDKSPQAVIRMKGNYTGSKILYFEILPIDISVSANQVAAEDIYFDMKPGKSQKVNVNIIWNGKKLGKKDFTLDKSSINIGQTGTDMLTITGVKNFTGNRTIHVTIGVKGNDYGLNKAKVTLLGKTKAQVEWKSGGYTFGKNDIAVKYGKDVLDMDTHYTIKEYVGNTAAGTATLVLQAVEGSGYYGTKLVTFRIVGADMNKLQISGEVDYKKTGLPYTGKPIRLMEEAGIKAIVNSKELTGEDYAVTYRNNMDKGMATAVFTGNPERGFVGTKKVTYKITAAVITEKDVVFTSGEAKSPIMKGGAKPELTVSVNGLSLEEGKDYTVSYTGNKGITDAATLKLKGKGNYMGLVSKTFAVVEKGIDSKGVTVVAKDKELKNNKWQQTFKVYDADGKALKAGKDYLKDAKFEKQVINEDGSMSYKEISEVNVNDIIRITVTGAGDYAGNGVTPATISGTYKLLGVGKDISKAKVKIANQNYSSKKVTLITDENTFTSITVGGQSLFKDGIPSFEIVEDSYRKNDKKGTAQVIIRGTGEFGGEKKVTFKIVPRDIQQEGNWWQGIIEMLFG